MNKEGEEHPPLFWDRWKVSRKAEHRAKTVCLPVADNRFYKQCKKAAQKWGKYEHREKIE